MRLVSFRNWRDSALPLLAVLLLSIIAYAIVGWLHFDDRVPAYQLLDDTASYAGVKWYTGFFSNLGILLWCASAAACGFAALLLYESSSPHFYDLARFLMALAVANILITFDDLFLVHEQLAKLLAGERSQHAMEGLIFLVYTALMAICFWWFRETIARTEYWLLIAAIVSVLASVAIDVGFQLELDGNNLFRETVLSVSWGAAANDIAEEILKLNGAMLWFIYFWRTGLASVREWSEQVNVSVSTRDNRPIDWEAVGPSYGAVARQIGMRSQDMSE